MASDSPHLKKTNFALCLESRTWLQLLLHRHQQFLDNGYLGSRACDWSMQVFHVWENIIEYKYVGMSVYNVQTCMECTYKGMQCKYIARLLFVNSATQAKAMPIRPKAMPIRPKAMPGREIQESQTAWKQHCMCCNPQMTWWVSFSCFHYLSLGSSLMMYKDMQGCTKICNAHNQIIGCRKKHCTKTNACQRILSLQKTYVEVCHKHMELHQTFLCTQFTRVLSSMFRIIRTVLFFWVCEVLRGGRDRQSPCCERWGMSMARSWTLAESFNPMYFWHHYKSKPVHQCYIGHHNVVQVPNVCVWNVATALSSETWPLIGDCPT